MLFEPQIKKTRVLEQHEADVVSFVLQQVVKRGTGTRAALRTPVAGKTGTTQSYGDAWFVGYTPGLDETTTTSTTRPAELTTTTGPRDSPTTTTTTTTTTTLSG